jgi:hypothetical protein
METNPQKKIFLQLLLGLGAVVSLVLIFSTLTYGIQTTISCSHIDYDIFLSGLLGTVGAFFYCVATIIPLFISNRKGLPVFGFLTLLSVGATCLFYHAYFTSVWCFFAALLSSIIIWIV